MKLKQILQNLHSEINQSSMSLSGVDVLASLLGGGLGASMHDKLMSQQSLK